MDWRRRRGAQKSSTTHWRQFVIVCAPVSSILICIRGGRTRERERASAILRWQISRRLACKSGTRVPVASHSPQCEPNGAQGGRHSCQYPSSLLSARLIDATRNPPREKRQLQSPGFSSLGREFSICEASFHFSASKRRARVNLHLSITGTALLCAPGLACTRILINF